MEAVDSPQLLVLAGPNGAGKSTVAPAFIQMLGVGEFVNVDEIAKGLSAFHPESVALQAGQLAIERMNQLGQARTSFAIETTLAARTYVGMIKRLRAEGYRVILVYVWLSSAELAIQRVSDRVRAGGHHIEDDVVRRRYQAGLDNLFDLYIPQVDKWIVCDGSSVKGALVIASGCFDTIQSVVHPVVWEVLKHGVTREPKLQAGFEPGGDADLGLSSIDFSGDSNPHGPRTPDG